MAHPRHPLLLLGHAEADPHDVGARPLDVRGHGLLLGVGAAFDFHAGLVPQAPPWMQRAGLEWLFRLAHEPRRLWRRYLRYNPRFVTGFARQYAAHLRRR